MNKSTVSLVRVGDRTKEAFSRALDTAFAHCPELPFVDAARSVLLKVDIKNAGAEKEERIVATSPALVEALGSKLSRMGCSVAVGDTPAASGYKVWHRVRQLLLDKLRGRIRGKPHAKLRVLYDAIMDLKLFQDIDSLEVAQEKKPLVTVADLNVETDIDFFAASGILQAAGNCQAALRYFDLETFDTVTLPAGNFLTSVHIAAAAGEAGSVVSAPRPRVSAEGRVEGAVANMFGIVPTSMRTPYERTAKLADAADELMVDVFSAVRPPPCAVVDASEEWGVLVVSRDCVAADAVLTTLWGGDPVGNGALRLAHESGLGMASLDSIELRGEPLENIRRK